MSSTEQDTTLCENCDEEIAVDEVSKCPDCGLDPLCDNCSVPIEHGCKGEQESGAVQHTPGPWVTVVPSKRYIHKPTGNDITNYEVFSVKTRHALRAEGHTHYNPDPSDVDNVSICSAFLRDMTLEEGQANARLIAAAPTMYEYLSKLAANGDTEADAILKNIAGS